jgi:hypothetical protein
MAEQADKPSKAFGQQPVDAIGDSEWQKEKYII